MSDKLLKLALFDAELCKLQDRYNYKIIKQDKIKDCEYVIVEEI